ncbi:MAG: hypothetical protein PVH77_12925 [Phycisphaerales bacterium]|jgi:hypothetical protein
MNEANLLLKAYYEVLYERLLENREILLTKIEEILTNEVKKRGFEDFDEERYTAYKDACVAFIDERIETYNPFGIQYTFDRTRAKDAFELELQLDWYDSRVEFQALTKAARNKAEGNPTDERLKLLAEELIKEAGAFPDKSIISAYETEPDLRKLPDYIVARTIEEILV